MVLYFTRSGSVQYRLLVTAVKTHALSIRNKEPMILIRFYCIAIHSPQMLYMIGIKEISFLRHQISLDLQTICGCHYACSINLII